MYLTKLPICLDEFLKPQADASCGASVVFVGRVRNHHRGRKVIRLRYECYESMANRQIDLVIHNVRTEFLIHDIRVLHRVGWIEIGEIAVAIVVHSAHRDEAFLACRSTIEQIKTRVPIWKEEHYEDGMCEWVNCAHETEVTA